MIAALTWRCVTRRGSKVHLVSDPRATGSSPGDRWRRNRTLCGRGVETLVFESHGDARAVSCEPCRRMAEGVIAFETRTVAALLEGRR